MTRHHRRVRPAAAAGTFYPGDPRSLADDVDQLLESINPQNDHGRICALVSPHAGYPYSGRIAAHGFRELAGQDAHTVVIIGPSHVEYFRHTSVFDGAAYETPLGRVKVNVRLARALCECDASIRATDNGHIQPNVGRGEHGIEVQLPFLQRVLPEAMIVPIVMGTQDWDACEALGAALAATCTDPGVVVVASSDLSHFYDYTKASALDTIFCDTLSRLDPRALHDAVSMGKCEACGAGPVAATLLAGEAHKKRRYQLLARANSGDITGDHSNVVGYACALFRSG